MLWAAFVAAAHHQSLVALGSRAALVDGERGSSSPPVSRRLGLAPHAPPSPSFPSPSQHFHNIFTTCFGRSHGFISRSTCRCPALANHESLGLRALLNERYGPELRNAVVHRGNTARLKSALRRARAGHRLNIGLLGGSVSGAICTRSPSDPLILITAIILPPCTHDCRNCKTSKCRVSPLNHPSQAGKKRGKKSAHRTYALPLYAYARGWEGGGVLRSCKVKTKTVCPQRSKAERRMKKEEELAN